MLTKNVEDLLNRQIKIEMEASYIYLGMASWAEQKGYSGVANFLYTHSDEERGHMLKILKYINERNGKAIVPNISLTHNTYNNFKNLFSDIYKHEVKVTEKIHEIVDICLKEKDYATNNFLQWYVFEQIEEEALVKNILDKLELLGEDLQGPGLYLFDRDISTLHASVSESKN